MSSRFHGFHADSAARKAGQLFPMVELRSRRKLASSRRAGQRPQRPRKISGGANRLRRRGGICEMGRQAPPRRRNGSSPRAADLAGKLYPWGDDLKPGGKFRANIYEGRFPIEGGDTGEDGFKGIAPVAQFPPNGSAYTMWRATCGSGAATGIARTPTHSSASVPVVTRHSPRPRHAI